MYHLKSLARSALAKQDVAATLVKILPAAANLAQTRSYADHQIPDRLIDVPTARGIIDCSICISS